MDSPTPITGQEVSRKAYLWPLCDLYGEGGTTCLLTKLLGRKRFKITNANHSASDTTLSSGLEKGRIIMGMH